MKQNLYEEALSEFGRTLNYDAACEDAIYNQGLVYKLMGNYKFALEKFKMLHKLDPQNIEYLMSIETYYSKLSDWENALIWNNRILEIQPDNEKTIRVSKSVCCKLKIPKVAKGNPQYCK